MDFDDFGALEAGTAYALMRHGQDRQTAQLLQGGLGGSASEMHVDVHVHQEDDEKNARPINALDFTTVAMPETWDDYYGQEPLKRQLSVYIKSAQLRHERLPHMMFASGYPGVGKTTAARLMAKSLGDVEIWELVPPFNIYTLVEAAQQLRDRDILFIDEAHLLGGRGSEILLKILEEQVAFMPSGEVVPLANFTVILATTEPDVLKGPVLDRIKITPYFQAYKVPELGQIAIGFAFRHNCDDVVDNHLALGIAKACRATPRVVEQMIIAARALADAFGRPVTTPELLEFLEVEPDGLTRVHIAYLTTLRQQFPQVTKSNWLEYIVGEATIQQALRETKNGLRRVEGFLIENGLLDRTTRGRRLTQRGIARAEDFIRQGKGVSVAL